MLAFSNVSRASIGVLSDLLFVINSSLTICIREIIERSRKISRPISDESLNFPDTSGRAFASMAARAKAAVSVGFSTSSKIDGVECKSCGRRGGGEEAAADAIIANVDGGRRGRIRARRRTRTEVAPWNARLVT